MKGLNYWQQFLSTGSVEDYLKFKEMQETGNISEECIFMGDSPYAGVCKVNRNRAEDSAYRGLR